MDKRRLLLLLLITSLRVGASEMADLDELNTALVTVAAAMGVLMIAIQGLKWITSDSPQDRAEAKKGLIYILLGLLVVAIAAQIVCGLYGTVISDAGYGISCGMGGGGCTCDP